MLSKYVAFITLFLGAGFMAGSIVHFGEGITVWDVSVLSLGVVLFVFGSYVQEKAQGGKNLKGSKFLPFILLSSTLSLGVGMASGGVQHFIDTPAYSALLIPFGLTLGYLSYGARERLLRSGKQWLIALCATAVFTLAGWHLLTFANTLIPESIRVGHGSHADHHTTLPLAQEDAEQVRSGIESLLPENVTSEFSENDGHAHSNTDAH